MTRWAAIPIVSLLAAAVTAAQAPPISRIDRQRAQQMLRHIRQDIEKHYYDPSYRGLNLDEVFGKAAAALEQAATLNDAYAVLTDTVMRLDDSHTVFFPPGRNLEVAYGWRMAMVGDLPLVVDVTPGSDAAAKGLERGDQVLALNRFTPERATLRAMQRYFRIIRPQALQHVVVRKPDGRQLTISVESKLTPSRFIDLTELLNEQDKAAEELRQRSVALNTDVLLWRMPVFSEAGPVEDEVRKARKYKTMVLDLRGNGGGVVSTLNTMVSRFFDRPVVIAISKDRKKEETYRAPPRREPYTGGLIVLVDSETGSAAEVFARVIQLEKRGTVIGDRTAGAVMTGRIFSHATGTDDQQVLYATMVTVADVRMSDGSSIEKVGVAPDEVSLPRPADLAARHDPVLARGLALAGVTITPEAAGKLLR
ncbi:MAG TPA: S41 family peptidase [Vicinamibacterales bacterium]|nr:S41 family peptidase [Vicinamibacterales bacterium]